MGESIDDYRGKRDFARTPEPAPGDRIDRIDRDGPPVFVVHRHEARNLHYDLRIEMEGVLRSWAVPKGFSYDPADKRLAVRTEDHPIEYEHFSGMIPKGEYGAGAMTIWDRGTWEIVKATDGTAAVAAGELKVVLRGRKLRGEWHLVKTKGGPNHWLLFKSKDRYAGPARDSAFGVDLANAVLAPLADAHEPMRAARSTAAFSDPAWVFEMAFEGMRLFAEKRKSAVRFRDITEPLPELERELARLRAENALLDGVLVVLDDGQRPSRALLEERLAGENDRALCYYAFDLLHLEEFDLRGLPLLDRKACLRAVLPEGSSVLFVDHVAREGLELAAAVAAAGLHAVIAKRADSAYAAGSSEDWLAVPLDAPVAENAWRAPVRDVLEKRAGAKRRSRVKLTNLEKVYWPREGYTKGDLVLHYERVADVLLPYLHDRPLHMYRWPDGIEGKSFYQHDAKEHTPDWVELVEVASDTPGKEGEITRLTLANDRDTLLYLANLGSIDLHPWMSRKGSLESPDWAILDLDPKSAPFENVVRIAREVGRLLRGIGLRPLLKTSGASGLHVYVPLVAGYTYDHSRMFCEGVARVVARDLRDIATVERAIGNREGKVYVDFGQNRMGQTVVPPYVPRPVPGASVSTPLHWDELDSDLSPHMFTIANTAERLERHGDLFRPALTDPQDLMPAIEALQSHLGGT